MRQGPHHGAQKSTSTGPSASRTSALKVASVTSVSLPVTGYRSPGIEVRRSGLSLNTSESIAVLVNARLGLFAVPIPESHLRYLPDGLDEDRAVHLRVADPAVAEN